MNKSYYFPHDFNARNDPKLIKLMMKYGMQGIGIFWCIVEMLYEQNGNLEVSECETIAFELRIDVNIILDIIENFELFEKKDGKYFSKSVKKRLNKIKQKSESAKKGASKRWKNKALPNNANALDTDSERNTNAMLEQSEGNANKRKEIKGKESKINNSDIDLIRFEIFWDCYDKKVGKPHSIEQWKKLTDEEIATIFGTVKGYVLANEKQFRKDPERYLKYKTFNDEIISNGNNPIPPKYVKREPTKQFKI